MGTKMNLILPAQIFLTCSFIVLAQWLLLHIEATDNLPELGRLIFVFIWFITGIVGSISFLTLVWS